MKEKKESKGKDPLNTNIKEIIFVSFLSLIIFLPKELRLKFLFSLQLKDTQ